MKAILVCGRAFLFFAVPAIWLAACGREAEEKPPVPIPVVFSLGMEFQPVKIKGGPTDGKTLYFCTHETRRKDYEVFFDDPKRISQSQKKDGVIAAYPWQRDGEPRWDARSRLEDRIAGNLLDATVENTPGFGHKSFLKGYTDGFAFTAPVKSFRPNRYGLFDISGNAREWVNDTFVRNDRVDLWTDRKAETEAKVLRGSSYMCGVLPDQLRSSLRDGSTSRSSTGGRNLISGFRCVIQ